MFMLLINRDQMARQLGCSLPTLDAMIKRWADFPVVERGDRGRPWKFDAEAVILFLQEKREEEERNQLEKNELLAQLTLPVDAPAPNYGNVDVKDLINAAKLRKLEREEAIEKRFLVRTHEVRDALEKALRRYGQAQDSAVDRVARAHNLPHAVKRALAAEFAEARTAFVRDAQEFLAAETVNDEQFALRA